MPTKLTIAVDAEGYAAMAADAAREAEAEAWSEASVADVDEERLADCPRAASR